MWRKCRNSRAIRWYTTTSSSASYAQLAETFANIETLSSRDAGIAALTSQYQRLLQTNPSELLPSIYITTAELDAPHKGKELGFRSQSFLPVLVDCTVNKSPDQVMEAYKSTGDFGLCARKLIAEQQILLEQEKDMLSIGCVHTKLLELADQTGKNSVARKQDIALELLTRCRTSDEFVFLTRLIAHQNLRIGMGVKSVVHAIAGCYYEGKEKQEQTAWAKATLAAFARRPDYQLLLKSLDDSSVPGDKVPIEKAVEALANLTKPETGIPIQVMLGYPVTDICQAIERMKTFGQGKFTCEYKYDGARLQIHIRSISEWLDGDHKAIQAFSRNSECSDAYYLPQLYEAIVKSMREAGLSDAAIIEGEVVAIDQDTKQLLPFQTLQKKSNKDTCFFVFDILSIDNRALVDEPFEMRRQCLHEALVPIEDTIKFVKSMDWEQSAENIEHEMGNCLDQALKEDCEGLMIKALGEGSNYKVGSRSHSWLKLKRDYMPTDNAARTHATGMFLPDTLDLVPIGANWGVGRRQGLFASFLMACYDPATNRYQTIGKVGTGFSDAQLLEITARLKDKAIEALDIEGVPGKDENSDNVQVQILDSLYEVNKAKTRQPDVWFSPEEVWEIRAAQLTRSTVYTAGRNLPDETNIKQKGFALRFPRFVRLRTDKNPVNATEANMLIELYNGRK